MCLQLRANLSIHSLCMALFVCACGSQFGVDVDVNILNVNCPFIASVSIIIFSLMHTPALHLPQLSPTRNNSSSNKIPWRSLSWRQINWPKKPWDSTWKRERIAQLFWYMPKSHKSHTEMRKGEEHSNIMIMFLCWFSCWNSYAIVFAEFQCIGSPQDGLIHWSMQANKQELIYPVQSPSIVSSTVNTSCMPVTWRPFT